jgi:hypothetical protein
VLVRVYEPHALDDPQDDVVEYFPQLAQAGYVLPLIEVLIAPFCLGRHLF